MNSLNTTETDEPLDITQLVDKATMFDDGYYNAGAIAWVAQAVCDGWPINDNNGRLREHAKVYHLAAGQRTHGSNEIPVLETFTVWQEKQFEDENPYISIRMSHGLLTLHEAECSGHEVDDDCDPTEVAAKLYWEVMRHMAIFRKPAIFFDDFEIFRVTKPLIGPKWEWSDWVV